MKKTVCDKCGVEFVGRNASGFHDILINGNTYVDLCEDCYDEYYRMKKAYYNNVDFLFNRNVESFLKGGTDNA